MKSRLVVLFLIATAMSVSGQKKSLDHSVYDEWKSLSNTILSQDGSYISYTINPDKGDGWLYLKNLKTGKLDSVARGSGARFTPSNEALVFTIEVPVAEERAAKKAKKKKDQMPRKSLGVWNLSSGEITTFDGVKSFKMPEKQSGWFAYLMEKSEPLKDTLKVGDEMSEEEKEEIKAKKKEIKEANDKIKKAKGTELFIANADLSRKFGFEDVVEYEISEKGSLVAFISMTEDSLEHSKVFSFQTEKQAASLLFEMDGTAKKPATDNAGNQVLFLFSGDTAKTKIYDLYYWKNGDEEASVLLGEGDAGIPAGSVVSENANLSFSESGNRAFLGTAPKPEPEEEDTLLAEEKVKLDVWNWKDQSLQPMQLVNLNREKRRNFKGIYHLADRKYVQLENDEVDDVQVTKKGDGNIGIGFASRKYGKYVSWDAGSYNDVFVVDIKTGKRELVVQKTRNRVSVSPGGKYLYWFASEDSSWYAYNIKAKTKLNLTDRIDDDFFYIYHDTPSPTRSNGSAGWLKEDSRFLVNATFDVWAVDPEGKAAPVSVTGKNGKANNVVYRYVNLERQGGGFFGFRGGGVSEEEYIKEKEPVIFTGTHFYNKKSGYFQGTLTKPAAPTELYYGDYRFSGLSKAIDADRIMFRRSTFKEYPDLWVTDMKFRNPEKISTTNPQQKEYLWGSVELVEWTSFDKQKLQGLLYKPENFDPEKKYPMIVYFYERMSNSLHRHITPRHISSSINFAYCVSNGYLIFVPDIPYKIGYPGESGYNAIVSGTKYLLDRYPYIDREHIGIQGHSWGGYQTAYIITKTDLYAAAEAGAPVSNMTSAYGGIRWASGMSRMFQYEETQSRIGGTLWEKPMHYIHNSPLFAAPNVNTPVLMLHNDEDGAVPWYQGIEFFVALRRLNKPVWMLNYNGEAHGLRKRPNRVDFSIRLMQFFDHFLKEEPAPEWLEYGIPATEKGINYGLEPREE